MPQDKKKKTEVRSSKPLGKSPKPFRDSFAKAKKAGKKTFKWKGNSYSTQTASEKAKSMGLKETGKAVDKAFSNYMKAKSPSKRKSYREIEKSYSKAHSKNLKKLGYK
tara:strand:+ start:145 stop:468 length:324 start_codon:yes stop_codon:yes gene_type:complete